MSDQPSPSGNQRPIPYSPTRAQRARQRLRLNLLRAFAALYRPPHRPATFPSSRKAPSILLIRPDHLGDLLFATPALRLLRQALPQARLSIMVGPWGYPVVTRNPHLDEVLVCEFPGFTRQARRSLLQPYMYLLRQAPIIAHLGFDLSAVLRFDHWWGGLLAYLAGIPRRIGHDLPEVASFLTAALPYRSDRHEVVQNLELAKVIPLAMGGAAATVSPQATPLSYPLEFPLTPDEETWAGQFLEARGLAGSPLIAIHPGAGAAVKLWRTEAWGQVADALAGRHRAAILLTGSAAEAELCRQVAEASRCRPFLAAGMTTLGQLGALYRRCGLVLGPDCGPLHLAVALGTPTVHLFGPVEQRKFGPWGDPIRHRVLTAGLPCMPCNHLEYGPQELAAHPCVRLIEVEQVVSAAEEILCF
jgi:ADP-heptose:LPS heptosyltransferase